MSRKTFIRSLVGKADPKRPRTGRFILEDYAFMRGVLPDDLIRQDRSQPLTSIRQDAYAHVRSVTKLSLTQIGRLFGGRDHTTIMHGIECSKARVTT